MNQLAKLYQTKCIQLQEQIENLERLLETAQTSPLPDNKFAKATAAAQKKQAEEVKQEQEQEKKKEEEEAAKPKEPDTVFSKAKKDYSTFYDIGKGILGGLIGLQALPRWGGGDQQQAGTLPSIATSETKIDPKTGRQFTVQIPPTVVPGQPGKAGSMFGRFPVSTAKLGLGIPLPIGGIHGVAERIDKYVENSAISAANKAAEVQVGALKDVSKAEEGVKAAQDALDAIPVIPSFAPNLAQAQDKLTAAQQNMSDAQQAAKAAEAEALAKKINAANRLNKASWAGRLTRAAGGAAAVAADASGVLPGAFNILDTLATDIPKQALSAAPAVLPAQGMFGSEVAAKAKDLAAKAKDLTAKTTSVGGKALGFLSPLETAASEVAGIGARALGLGAEVAGAAAMAPLAIGGITRSAGAGSDRVGLEAFYDDLEKRIKQQNASAVQSLIGRGYNPEGRSATRRQ